MAETLRILFINDLYAPFVGGATTHQLELAKGLVTRGHRVRVITSRIPGTARSQELDGVEIYRITVGAAYERYLFALLSIPPILRHLDSFDIVQAPTFIPAFPASVCARLGDKPVLLTVHELFGDLWPSFFPGRTSLGSLFRAAEKAALHLPFHRYVAVSNYTRKALLERGIPSAQCETIYPGIDYSFWTKTLGQQEDFRKQHGLGDRFIYMSYGRAGISKGMEFLLAAAEIVAKTIPEAKLLLVLNEGPMFETLANRIRGSHALANHVILKSNLKLIELRDALSSADCVVVPSLSEGFGFAIAEAGAMGKPVIASDVGSVPEVVSGKNILVPSRDSKALADAIARGYNGDWNSAPLKQFRWDTTLDKYEDNLEYALDQWENHR